MWSIDFWRWLLAGKLLPCHGILVSYIFCSYAVPGIFSFCVCINHISKPLQMLCTPRSISWLSLPSLPLLLLLTVPSIWPILLFSHLALIPFFALMLETVCSMHATTFSVLLLYCSIKMHALTMHYTYSNSHTCLFKVHNYKFCLKT